jgi:3'-5' exonuclease
MRIYLDVETVPGQAPDARDLIRASIKPPGTLKKPESIAAWWQDAAPEAVEEAWRKTALDASQGELVAISWATDDTGPFTAIRAKGDEEQIVLAQFFGQLQACLENDAVRDHRGQAIYEVDPFFVAHNAAFDLGFLWRRSIVLNIRPPFRIPAPDARPGSYGCTMRAWSGLRDQISLDRLCRALGVQSPKGDMDGSKVYDAWQVGELDRIQRYNQDDVTAVRECWHRLNWEAAA